MHGQQVGVASLTLARLQRQILDDDKVPQIGPTMIDEADMIRRVGPEIAKVCVSEMKQKAFDAAGADKLNAKLNEIWPNCAPSWKPSRCRSMSW